MNEILPLNELQIVKSLESVQVSEIAAGETHALFKTSEGRVFGLGSNRMGQLSSQDKEYKSKILSPIELQTIWSPVQVMAKPMEANCAKIAAGGETSLFAIDRPDGTQVLGCGFGQWGQIGHGGVCLFSFIVSCMFKVV
jgi:alpha-tubulin suppressor-like RCC1 family protein